MKRSSPTVLEGVTPGFKMWLSRSGEGAFGHGKWQLLEAIHREGSLRAAADALGISYRKAWGDLRKAERVLGIAFLERHRGGLEGGESCLTEDGKKWLKEYGRFQSEVEDHMARAFARWVKRMGR